MPNSANDLRAFVANLDRHAPLAATDRDAILALPHHLRAVSAGAHLSREGDGAVSCNIILSGYTCRHKVVGSGARQIVAVHMAGDCIDLQNALLSYADQNVQAVTRIEVATIPASAMSDLLARRPGVARAIMLQMLFDSAVQREWIANIGQRDARSRLCHLLCEIGMRQEAAAIGHRDHFYLPLTQEQLADATGMTTVHINRLMQALKADGTVAIERRMITISDWERLARTGDFHPAYLKIAQPVQPVLRLVPA